MMGDATFWARLVLASLAVWRVTHLLASEDGPWDVIARVRSRLGHGVLGRLMDCFYCLSLWVAAPAAWYVSPRFPDLLAVWLAVSGAACLLERAGGDPVIVRPLTEERMEEEQHDGLLR